MDPAIIASIIGAAATVAAAAFGFAAHKRRSESRRHAETAPSGEFRSPPPPEPLPDLRICPRELDEYEISFTPECLEDLERAGADEVTLLRLVRSEFESHINYFLYDLEDYVMPLKTSLLVFLDKVGDRLTFKRVIPCTTNEAKLASWNDILTLYRRATRMGYRQDPGRLLAVKSMLPSVRKLHMEMIRRLGKHFTVHEGFDFEEDGGQENVDAAPPEVSPSRSEIVDSSDDANGARREIGLYLSQAFAALQEAGQIEDDRRADLVDEATSQGALVACLEKSLQWIHKVLIRFPPTS